MTMPLEPQAPGAPAGQQPEGGQQPAAAPPQEPQQPSTQTQDVSQLPDWAQKIIADTRAEAARHRTEKKAATEQVSAEQARVAAILKAAGINADGEEQPDPEALASQLEERGTELWSKSVELETYHSAVKHGVKAEALTDSVAFWEAVGELDPSDPEFAAGVDAAIAAAVKANPGLKVPQGAARSGADFTGSPGAPPNIDQQIAEATEKKDFRTAIALKRRRMAGS
jgi:hypothetical protein